MSNGWGRYQNLKFPDNRKKTYRANAIPPEQQHLNKILFDLWKYAGVLTDWASDIKYISAILQICENMTKLLCRRRPSMTLMLNQGRGRSASGWERLVPSFISSWQCCWWPLCYKLLKTSTKVLSSVNCQLAILFSYLQLGNNYNWNHKLKQQSFSGAEHHQNWCWWRMVGRWERQKTIKYSMIFK